MPSSANTLEAMQKALDALGVKATGPIYHALLDLEEAAWAAGYEAAKAGYARIDPE
jgi:hypothetical protein